MVESYKTDDTDLTAQLTKIRGENPEVLIVWGTNPGPALAAKNMKQLGMDIPYVGSHGIANKTFIELAGEAAEGVVFPAGRLLVPASITDPAQKEVTDLFVQRYSAAYGGSPNTFAGYACEAISLLVDAIERAGSTEPGGHPDSSQRDPGLRRPGRRLQLLGDQPRRSDRRRHDHREDRGRHLGAGRIGLGGAGCLSCAASGPATGG